MASYWWPLGGLTVPAEPKGSAPAGAPTAAESGPPKAPSGRTSVAAAHNSNAAAASAADARHLARAAFHTSLENLLVESTKHRGLAVLRDAVLDTRQRQYDPASIFETLCIACTLLAERSSGGTAVTTRRHSSNAARPTTSSPATRGSMSRSSSGAALYAMGSGNEPPHVPVTAAEAATLLTAGAHASSAASPPHPLRYRHNAASRELLLQSIGDIGKLIALALLPVTQQVGRRVADLVRALAFQPSPTPSVQPSSLGVPLPARAALPPPTWTTSASAAPSSAPQSHSTAPQDKDLSSGLLNAHCGGGAVPSAAATATVSAARPVHLVHDDPVLVRLLQMTASAASRCPLGSSALAELYGVLLLFYSGVAPQSMLEATCEATLTHHIHAVLAALHDSGAGDDGVVSASSSVTLTASTFAAQLQGVAFIKDVCRLMVGARTRWLHLSPYSTSTPAPGGAAGGEGATAVSDSSHSNKRGAAEHHRGSTPSSMAGITASVTAAAADASRQRAQEQQQLSLSTSLMSKSMLGSLAVLSPAIQHELDAISAASAAGAVSGACGLGGAAELSSLSSLAMTVPACAAMETVPERLRLFLMRAVTLFFKEQAKALAAPAVATAAAGGGGGTDEGASRSSAVRSAAAVSMQSPLYAQCLNDCFFSVALWGLHEMGITVSMQPPPALFVEVQEQQQRDGPFSVPPCSLEVFMCTQQLVLVSISTHLHSMTNSTQVLLEAHERLLQRLCRRRKPCATSSSQWLGSSGEVSGGSPMSSDDAERLSQAATVVLSLWRKTLTSATLLWELLQLRSMQGGHRGDHSTDEVAAGMSVDTETYRSSGWYSNEEWRASPTVERNGYNSDSSGIAVPSQRWSPSAHGSSVYRQRASLALSRSRDYLTGSQNALDVKIDSEKDRASTPPAPGLGNTAAVGEKGGTGVDATTVPLLVRLVLSVLALAVSHMQLHANNILQVSADDKSTDGKRGGGDGEEAEGAVFTGLLLRPSTPPRFLSAGDSGDDIVGEPSLKRSPRHIGPAAANAVGAAAAAPIPLCLCVANASIVYQCFTEVLNGLTAFGQLFSQLVDTQRMPSVAAADKEQVLRRCRECFLVLHPHLLHCEQLCLRHLRYEEDVLPVVLKATGYWVQVSCVLQLPEQRDAHLAALVDVLRTQDPVDGHLVALAPPTALGMSDTASPTTTMLLEALLTLNGVCAAAEPIVPGSVAAAALSPSSDRDAASPGSRGGVKGIRQYALSMSSWGAEWLRRRGLKTSSSACGSTASPARAGGGGSGSWTVSPAQSQINATPSGERGGAGARPSLAAPPRIGTPTPIATTSRSKQQQPASASWAMPPVLTSHGWRAPAVQHAVILGVCRLQHKLFIMKTLHVIANNLGAQLESGWTLLARGLAVTEPLLHMLKRLLSWIEESAEEQEQQEQLLSDALHLRDALRSLCVHNACQLPYSQFEIFFAELVSAALALGAAAPSQQQDGAALASNHWGCGDLHAAACAAASDRLPRHHPQGCGGQWVLTSECLSVSLLAMLPFIELRYTDATDGVATGKAGDGSGGGDQPGAQAVQLQHQRTGALARALYLWELETTVCRYVTDHQHVEEWGRTLLTTMKMHKRALLATTASSSVEPAATDPDTPLGTGSLSQEETRTIELVLFTVVGHVSTVAVQICRSSSRRRAAAATSAGGEGGSPLNDTGSAAPSLSYQAVQSAALMLTSGPFAAVPLTQVANALFAASAASGSSLGTSGARDTLAGVGSGGRLPFLPFVQADAAQSIARLHAAVHRSSQAIALHTAADDSRSSVATAPPVTTASVHFDPLEQLLASPFALLDRVYGEWQLQYAGSPSRGGGQGGRSTAVNAAEQHELGGRISPTPLNTNEARELPQRGERSTSSEALEASAAFSVVAGAVPQLLANAAAAVLMDVVKIVQSYGEAIDGAAWEAILSLLQRTAMAVKEQDNALTGMSVGAAGGSGSHTQSSVSIDSIGGRSASSTSLGKPGSKAPTSAAGATVSSSQAVESLNTAFRALESIQHNHIPRLNADGLHRLIVCVGTFTVHRVDGGAAGERKLHTNLSAVQLLWSIADYLAAFGSGAVEEIERGGADNNANGGGSGTVKATAAGCAGAAAGGMPGSPTRCSDDALVAQQQQQHDRLWCSLLWQLRNGCLDDRQEVRQSALQTFFALVQTYGWSFSAACWRCVLQDVLLPLMEIVAVATGLCATPPPSPPEVGEDDAIAVAGAAGGRGAQDVTRQRLLRSFMDHPPQLEEVRVAVFNAGSRLFVTHYAHMQVAASALSSPSSARSPRPRLPIAEEDKDDATQVLECFLRLCGDVCVVLRGTSGEQAAMAAVHALHGLLVEMPGKGLHAHGVHLAWSALERLILRGGGGDDCADSALAGLREGTAPDPDAQRRAKQRTNAVVAATVAAVCDSFRLQRLAAAVPDAAVGSVTATSPSAVERSRNATGFSSYFSGWGGGGGIAATVAESASRAELRHSDPSSPAPYFTRLLFLLQAVTCCPAVVNSYYFPSKAQATLLEGVAAVWPTLSSREARTIWCEVLLPAFPPAARLQSFVVQDLHESVSITVVDDAATNAAATAAASTLIPLKSVMPPGSHPGYLSAVMETMRGLMLRHMGADAVGATAARRRGPDGLPPDPASANTSAAATEAPAKTTDEDRARLAFMAPSTVQVSGTLLLLHLAPATVLEVPPRSGSVSFNPPALFLQECVNVLQYTLWEPVLARTRAPPPSLHFPCPEVSNVSPPSAAAVQCRRDGVAALCRVFELLLTTTSTVVRHLHATPPSGAAATSGTAAVPTTTITPPHVTAALQLLDLLVDTLGEVVHFVVELYEDVVCATTAITALTIASTAECTALDRVARRSLSLLQRWAGAVSGTPSARLAPPSCAATLHHHQHTRSGSDGICIMSPSAQGTVAHHNVCAQSQPAAHATAPTATSRSKLQDVVRASMESRTKAIMAQFVGNPDDASAAALLVNTLRDMLHVAQSSARGDPRTGSDAATQNLSTIMPDLLRLVACSSREPHRSAAAISREQEMRELLANLLALAMDEQRKQLAC